MDETEGAHMFEVRNIRRLLTEIIHGAICEVDAYPLSQVGRVLRGDIRGSRKRRNNTSPRLRLENAFSDACWLLCPDPPAAATRTYTLYECCEGLDMVPQSVVPKRTLRKARKLVSLYTTAIEATLR